MGFLNIVLGFYSNLKLARAPGCVTLHPFVPLQLLVSSVKYLYVDMYELNWIDTEERHTDIHQNIDIQYNIIWYNIVKYDIIFMQSDVLWKIIW